MHRTFTRYILLLFLMLLAGKSMAQEEVYISLTESYSQELTQENVRPFIKFYEDLESNLSYADVLMSYVQGEFKGHTLHDSLYNPSQKSTWWMAVPLKSNANGWKEYWFNAGGEFLVWDSINIYTLYSDKSVQEQRTGRMMDRSEWKAPVHPNYFSVRLDPGDSALVLLAMTNYDKAHLTPDQLYFEAIDFQKELQANLTERFTVGLFLGILSIQLLFFLLFFMITKDDTFGYYVLYILGLTGVVFFTAQTDFHLLRLNLSMAFIISAVFVLFAIIGLLRFSISYLNIKEKLPAWGAPVRWFERTIICLTIFLMLAIGTFVKTGDTSLSTEDGLMSVLFILGILLYILMFVLLGITLLYWGVQMMRVGLRPARFYLMGNSVFILGVLLYILSIFLSIGQIEIRETLSSMELIRGGIILQLCLFAVALGAKRNLLEKEKRDALEDKLKLEEIVSAASSRFVPYDILRILGRTDITEVALGDQVEQNSTVFFSDIRNYTTLSEKLSPQETFKFLNTYLGRVGPIIESYGGFVNQFLGDGIMALFMEETLQLSSSENTLRAAIKIQEEILEFNRTNHSFDIQELRMGIGIHHGPLMVGIIGDEQRMDIGVVSDTVNTASRMEGLTKIFGASIILSEVSYRELKEPESYTFRYLGKVKVKGRQQALGIYDCYDAENSMVFEQKAESRILFEEGLEAYFAKDFKYAGRAFEEVLTNFPEDNAAKFYLTQTKGHLIEGTPEGWNGVLLMNKK